MGPRRMQILSAEYEKIMEQSSVLLAEEKDLVANAANLTALLFEALEAVDWVGIYFLRNGELILGPFQGRSVKPRVSLGRSAAGRVVRDMRSTITEGRALDEGSDDDLSQAQVIVPILLHDRCVGVLEIDSPFAGRFDDHDRVGLEAIATLLIQTSDTAPLIPRRTSISELRTSTSAASTEMSPALPTIPTVREETPARKRAGLIAPATRRMVFVALAATGLFIGAICNTLTLAPSPTVTSRDLFIHAAGTIVAFGIFGTTLGTARRMGLAKVAGLSLVYAAFLACMQSLTGAQTSMSAHFGNLMCGLLGGYLGGATGRALRRRSPARQRAAERHRS